ncbi:sodium/myo-inositol cotransporter 2-like [Diadema antillarum]|uniref:sodium/myo-inositol cotransporter 2-like n=1 Tax=Diadema antillarum TaxID=105358 RepID=UPI003A85EE1F
MATETAEIGAADIAIIVVYFVFVIAVGLWSMYKTNRGNASGYFLAGRSMLWLPIGASLFASNIGTGHFIGLAGTGAASGLAVAAYEIMASFAILLLGWIFLPVYVSSGVYTMPEYLRVRFGGQRLRIFMSLSALFLYVFTKISVDIFAGAVFIQQAFNWNIYASIFILLAVTAVYTITGGLAAVIYTDTLQSFIMVIGGVALMIISFVEIGGLDELRVRYMQAIPSSTLNDTNTTCGYPRGDAFSLMRHPVTSDQPWPGTIIGIMVIGVWYWCTDQVIVQRSLAAKNVTHAKGGSLLAGYLKLLPQFLIVMPGMIARVLYTDEVACVDSDSCMEYCQNPSSCSNIAYPLLILRLMPTGARGLMMAVMIAALMSSLTSIFNSGSTIFTMDVWRRLRPKAKNTELMIVGRAFVLVLVGVSILWVPIVQVAQGGQLFQYIQSLQSYFAPSIFICFVSGVIWQRTNEQGAFWGLVAGVALGLTRMILDIIYPEPGCGVDDTRPSIVKGVHFLYYNCIVTAVSMIVTIAVSLLTEKPTPAQVMGKTFWTRGMDPTTGEPARSETGPDKSPEGVELTKPEAAKESGEEKKSPEKDADARVESDATPNSQNDEEKPKWKRCLYWFLGYQPDEDHEVPEEASMIKSIEENPFWQKFALVNAVVLCGVCIAMMVWWW